MISLKTFVALIPIIEIISTYKIWQHNLHFDNPRNWISGKVPSPGQPIHFPAKLNAIVNLPETVSVQSIILPQTGVLLVPGADFSLVFENEPKHREPASFETPVRRPYYGSDSWLIVDESTNTPVYPNSAMPHTERIPCQFEKAIFSGSPAPVDLQYHEAIIVKNINYANNEGLDEFRHFLSTELGQFVFFNGEETLIKEGKCGSPEKCPCQPEWVKSAVCANEVCDVPRCLKPIVPVGHCCAICGSMLTMDLINFGGKFELGDFSRKLERKIAASQVDESLVDYHVSVQNDALQLVIVDVKDYDEKSIQMMRSLEPFFLKLFLNGHNIVHSGRPYVPYESGQLFLVVFLSLLMVSIFFTIIYVYYYDDNMIPRVTALIRNRQFFLSPFVFARFDPNNDNEESTVDINFNPSGVENLNSSFNNPMFEENAKEASTSGETGIKDEQELYVDVELKSHN
ncbi:protein amnionless [Topomyia yanbarensis]|uniref:protein amnionless n=1 Tax=Topomyia yanbarensis TaxID=2498891 RepID=UPI00273CC056|nr:protein amnionless [Topomyia yanbarensis]